MPFNNENHPELREGELFLRNVTPPAFTLIWYQTKRMGKHAYDSEGNKIEELRPVFVQESEYDYSYSKE